MSRFVGPENRALCGSPNPGTNSAHIRKEPKNPDERLLQDRPDKAERWSVIPWSVLVDEKLEAFDCRVYAALSSRAIDVDTFQIGTRWIAATLRAKKGRVQASMVRLISRGHVIVEIPARGSRAAVYRLPAPVFAKRQKVSLTDREGSRDTTRYELERKIELARKLKAGAA